MEFSPEDCKQMTRYIMYFPVACWIVFGVIKVVQSQIKMNFQNRYVTKKEQRAIGIKFLKDLFKASMLTVIFLLLTLTFNPFCR